MNTLKNGKIMVLFLYRKKRRKSAEENKDLNSPEDLTRMKDYLESMVPDIVIMPIGKDSNQTHAWVYQAFQKCAKDLTLKTGKPIIALYNEDPKTIEIRKDLFVLFGEEGANWKRALLRAHDTQQQRNIHRRGMGFDEVISSSMRLPQLLFRQLNMQRFLR
jgi:hypothetical protein